MKFNHGLINQKWSSQNILVNKTFLLSASKSTKHGFLSWWDIFSLQFWGGKNVCARLIPNFTSTKGSKSKQRIWNRKQQEILPFLFIDKIYRRKRHPLPVRSTVSVTPQRPKTWNSSSFQLTHSSMWPQICWGSNNIFPQTLKSISVCLLWQRVACKA